MPTFETDDHQNRRGKRGPLIAPHSGPGFEYRPRRREGSKRNLNSDSFLPAPVPQQVKDEIQKRIGDMMRKSTPPDENMDRMRDAIRLGKTCLRLLGSVIRKKLGIKDRPDDSDDDEPYALSPDEETGEQKDPQSQPYSNRRRKKRPTKGGSGKRPEKGEQRPKHKRQEKHGRGSQGRGKPSAGKQEPRSQPQSQKAGPPPPTQVRGSDAEQADKARRSRRRGRRGGKKKGANPENQGGTQNSQS